MMDQLFSEAFVMPAERRAAGQREQPAPGELEPPVNMYETDTDLMVVLPIPGVSPNDIEVELLGTQLSVRTTARRDEPHPNVGPRGGDPGPGDPPRSYYLHEFQIGPHARVVELPYAVDPDKVQTSYEHGLLALRFPCPQAKVPRRIPLQRS
jgi:HSP20 family protein